MPIPMMLAMSCLGTTKFLAYFDGDTPVGLVYLGKLGREGYLLFFAVDEALRSRGYGGRILADLRARYPRCHMAVSIEPCLPDAPDLALRQRRKGFYLRNGCADTGYSIRIGGIWQELLVSGGTFSRLRFSLFLIVYSCFAMLPILRKRSAE